MQRLYGDDWRALLEAQQAEEEDEEVRRKGSDEEKKNHEKLKETELAAIQEKALNKQKARTELMGELLRSKGFFWMATSNDGNSISSILRKF